MKSHFELKEENGVVIATLSDNSDTSFHRTIHSMPNPRVRAPRLTKDEIEINSKSPAMTFNQSQKEYLTKNIKGINTEINKHIQEIRKSIKRIRSLTHYVIKAQEVLDEAE